MASCGVHAVGRTLSRGRWGFARVAVARRLAMECARCATTSARTATPSLINRFGARTFRNLRAPTFLITACAIRGVQVFQRALCLTTPLPSSSLRSPLLVAALPALKRCATACSSGFARVSPLVVLLPLLWPMAPCVRRRRSLKIQQATARAALMHLLKVGRCRDTTFTTRLLPTSDSALARSLS